MKSTREQIVPPLRKGSALNISQAIPGHPEACLVGSHYSHTGWWQWAGVGKISF